MEFFFFLVNTVVSRTYARVCFSVQNVMGRIFSHLLFWVPANRCNDEGRFRELVVMECFEWNWTSSSQLGCAS